MLESICIFSDGYPTPTDPFLPFVEQLAMALVDNGIDVTVIAPQSVTKHLFRKTELHPLFHRYHEIGNKAINVYQPYTVSLGRKLRPINTMIDKLAVKRVLKKIETPQAVYGHFWHCAYFAYYFARKAQLPLFVATGESDVRKENHFDIEMAKDFFKYVSGVICVSNKNKEESVTLGFTTPDKCVVLPNAINPALFYKQDRDRLREKYGYNQSDFIVVFTGTFEHRKGPKRVAQAISLLNNENIKSFFIGRGQDENLDDPNCEGILFKSHLDHKLLPDYLNMADVFCLPTLKEGCCNAIIEALGCGLPIISSDLSFNYDILDDSNSILIDPMNIEQIAGAIKELYDDPMLRARLSSGALKTANKLTIDQRAKSIKFFIETKGKL